MLESHENEGPLSAISGRVSIVEAAAATHHAASSLAVNPFTEDEEEPIACGH